MANSSRIYVVRETTDKGTTRRLVKAPTQAQAIRHVVEPKFAAEVATTDEVAELVGSGTKVEDAGAESPGT